MNQIMHSYFTPQASDNYTFTRSNLNRRYVKILQAMNEFPLSTKKEIMRRAFPNNPKACDPGYFSTIWRSLNRLHLVKMFRDGHMVRYQVDVNGFKVLRNAVRS